MESGVDEQFEQILLHLRHTRGFDFGAYKRTSLMRRIRKRMQVVGVESFEAYLDYLQVHQEEFAPLFNTILINVTSFFRDPEVWNYLAETVLPELIASLPAGAALRVWSAGCASGQEPFTVAMMLSELKGPAFVRDRVKIYATDIDEEALNEARVATYSRRQLEDVAPPLIEKHFEPAGANFTFNRELRRSVIFGRHDLLQDAPISRVDLLLCRNTLMYFNSDAQARILARFYFSLNPSAYIVLGRAEMLFSHAAMFAPAEMKRRVFRPASKPSHRDRLLLLAQTGRDLMTNHTPPMERLREIAFESDELPQLVLDDAGMLAGANLPARGMFGLTQTDVGRPFQDLSVSFRPVELRGAIQRASDERQQVTIKEAIWPTGAEIRSYDVTITPLLDPERVLIGTRISFHDNTAYRALENALQQSKQELETAYEELQSTNEELETTNEELQSTVEELETTNEELQSTNEELETMNEELQSTNEELQTINDELRTRSGELNAANTFMESVFASMRAAVVNRDFEVLVWNDNAADLWGVRPDEATGHNFLGLDIGLPVGELGPPIRSVLQDGAHPVDLTLNAVNRRGKPIGCRIQLTPLVGADNATAGVILMMEER
jgi:two-component system CheB/CheR fusion protein